MKFLVAVLVALLVFFFGPSVGAQRAPDATLDGVASRVAGREVHVVCLEDGEPGAPGNIDAWGYVFLGGDNEFMAPEVCDGLTALVAGDAAVPLWKQALGALVLTHESFHLNQAVRDPGSEARTECRAIKNFARTVRLLHDDVRLTQTLLSWALAIHWRIARLDAGYYWESCKVPNPW